MILKLLTEEQQARKSERLRDDIFSQISIAEIEDLSWTDPDDVEEAKLLAQELNIAYQMLNDNKVDLLREHKEECYDRLKEVKKSHDAWWKAEKRYRRDQKEEQILHITLYT